MVGHETILAAITRLEGCPRNGGKFTSRFIRAKESHSLQDELSNKFGLDVRIYDRNWILDKIIQGRHFDIFAKELGYTTQARSTIIVGKYDSEKKTEMDLIEERIDKIVKAGKEGPEAARLALDVAIFSRELENPKETTKNYFARALRYAKQHGLPSNEIECVYQMGWTAAWWHEDLEEFTKRYKEYRKLISGTVHLFDIERLINLWVVLKRFAIEEPLIIKQNYIIKETRKIKSELQRFISFDNMPSLSLEAKTLYAIMGLYNGNIKEVEEAANTLRDCLLESEQFIGFPVERVVNIVTEISQYISGRRWFEDLYDLCIKVSEKTAGDMSSAHLLIKRSITEIHNGRFLESLKFISRCTSKLKTKETSELLAKSFGIQAYAYEQIHVLWAARAAYLTAAAVAMFDFWSYEEVNNDQVAVARSIKWIELRLGNIARAIRAFEVEMMCGNILQSGYQESEKIALDHMWFELGVCILLLRTLTDDFSELEYAPDYLDRIGLLVASETCKFILGHDCKLPDGLGAIDDFINDLLKNPISEQVAKISILESVSKLSYQSNISGCAIYVTLEVATQLAPFARALLGFCECVMSTALNKPVMPRCPEINVVLTRLEGLAYSVTTRYDDSKRIPSFHLSCSGDWTAFPTRKEQEIMTEAVQTAATEIISRTFVFGDGVATIDKIMGEEGGLVRAVEVASSIIAELKLFGGSQGMQTIVGPKAGLKHYEYKRKTPLPILTQPEPRPRKTTENLKFHQGKPPPKEINLESATHSNVSVSSIIKIHLWERAKWRGTSFGFMDCPFISFVFENLEISTELWEALVDEIGNIDSTQRLRISFIRGISASKPHAYRVGFGPGEGDYPVTGEKGFQYMTYRANTMEATNPRNLGAFEKAVKASGRVKISASVFNNSGIPKLISPRMIEMTNIHFRNAYEVGELELDSPFIHIEDDIIFPDKNKEYPVHRLLKRLHDN